jgi:hypothetical protein
MAEHLSIITPVDDEWFVLFNNNFFDDFGIKDLLKVPRDQIEPLLRGKFCHVGCRIVKGLEES